jgi:hypothetical protein
LYGLRVGREKGLRTLRDGCRLPRECRIGKGAFGGNRGGKAGNVIISTKKKASVAVKNGLTM